MSSAANPSFSTNNAITTTTTDHVNVDIDAITEPKDPVSKQLLDLVALDAAIEDALYYMEKSLAKGDVTADVFLKVNSHTL